MPSARVTVVVSFLNAQRFLREAIDSVFAQTYERWTLLLVDDGSTDASTDMARDFAARHPKQVRYLDHPHHQNRGLPASRNHGIKHADTEYIALLDADDVWLSDKLERQIAILDSEPRAAMVYGASQFWRSWTGAWRDAGKDYVRQPGIQPDALVAPPTLLALSLEGRAASPCPSDLMFTHDMVRRSGGFEETFPDMYEDQAFLAKVYVNESVFVTGHTWIKYRLHPLSISAVGKKAGMYRGARRFYLDWLQRYLHARNIRDPRIVKALRWEMFRCRHPVLYRLHPGYFARRLRRVVQRPVTISHARP